MVEWLRHLTRDQQVTDLIPNLGSKLHPPPPPTPISLVLGCWFSELYETKSREFRVLQACGRERSHNSGRKCCPDKKSSC